MSPLLGGHDLRPVGEDRWELTTEASFNQGRGTFGGLLAAAIGRACELAFPGWPLRALSLHLCAPATPGGVVVEVREQRRGSRTLFAQARVLVGDRPVLVASLTLAHPRASDADYDHTRAPLLPRPSDLPDVFRTFEGPPPSVPAFTQHFDFRIATGIPFTGGEQAVSRGWIRPRTSVEAGPSLTLALLDAWPLAVLATLPGPRPVASIAIHMQLHPGGPAIAADAFYCVDMYSTVNRQGYSDQHTSLFAADGSLLGQATQLVAIIR